MAPAALAIPILLGGCVESSVFDNSNASLQKGMQIGNAEQAAPYTIHRGDDITVRFYYNPQLDEDLRVRPDGAISMSLIGEVQAAGKTPTQLSDAITGLYAEYLTKPKAVVLVRGFAQARAFVAGEVSHPGVISLAQGSETVSQSIASSGGVTDAATLRDVLLVRRVPGQPQPVVISLNIADAIGGKDPTPDLTLLPDDLVYVPKSGAANVNTAIRLYILNNVAFGSTGLGVNVTP
jgi:protein involved in polysaccharide export with SLBB domain